MTKKKITLEDGRYLIYFSFAKSEKAEQTKETDKKGCCGGKCGGGSK